MGKISTPEVLRLRATSPVSRDQSVRRSAQDDDFVGVLTKNILDKLALIVHGGGIPSDEPKALLNQMLGVDRWVDVRVGLHRIIPSIS